MKLSPHIQSLHRDLANAASLGDEATQQAATRLLVALDPALRMTMVELLSQAASQLSADLGDIAIDLRMAGREPEFVITRSSPAQTEPTVVLAADPEPDEPEDASMSRLTLRLPEGIKTRADEAASRQGKSLNTWVVDAVRQALTPTTSTTHRAGPVGRRMTGWV